MATSEPRKRTGPWGWVVPLACIALFLGMAVFFAAASQWWRAAVCVGGGCAWAYQAFIRPARIRSGREVVPRFRVLRALRATGLDGPHYFLEVDDQSLRGRFTVHLSGLWLLQFEPLEERARRFPSTEIAVFRAEDDDGDPVTGEDFSLMFVGEAFEPTMGSREVPPESPERGWLTSGWEPIPISFDDALRYFTGRLDTLQPMPAGWSESRLGPDVWRIKARHALRVESSVDKRLHYYLELDDARVLHLSGRQLRDLEVGDGGARLFPCSEFEPINAPASLLDLPYGVNPVGEPFQPVIAQRKISAADRDQGWVPQDWGRLDRPYEEIAAHFGAVPAQASPDLGPPAERQPPSRPVPTTAVEPFEATATTPIDQPLPLSEPLFSTSFDDDFAVDDKDRHER